MGLNFKEALATVSRALPLVLLRAGIFVAGGFMVIIIFAMLLFAFRPGGGVNPAFALFLLVPVILSGWAVSRLLQRNFLFRHRAAMFYLFSGRKPAAPGLAGALQEVGRFFPEYSSWAAFNSSMNKALAGLAKDGSPAISSHLVARELNQAVLVLAFSRGGTNAGHSTREALALFLEHGEKSRNWIRQWSYFSLAGLAFLFLCLALPNWIFFNGAGAPVWIGIVLAAAITWLLHQAFVVPLVLAGVCGALLTETSGKIPDQSICEKLDSLIPGTTLPNKRAD
jgi:hypothetical protein